MTTLFKFLYKRILKPIVFLLDPEYVHTVFLQIGESLGKYTFTRKLISPIYKYKGANISKIVNGIKYETPIILSGGFDYNGQLTNILDTLSFGGVEIGSITFKPTAGNKRPRLTRAKKSKSIIVWKGLKNEGVVEISKRLQSRAAKVKNLVVGISIARTIDPNAITEKEGIIDYASSLKYLVKENIGDYYTINISCPNAKGGETFAEHTRLDKLLKELIKYRNDKPLYVKLPINTPWNEFKKLVNVCQKYKMQGVIIGNLNKNYNDIDYREEAPDKFRGGLSGKPCKKLSDELIRKTRDYVGSDFTIIGVGGILTPQDALDKLEAGADLIMLITGMIFEGPHLMKEICEVIEEKGDYTY